ncbi:MAG: hypothetical protein WKF87_18820 [Chryseolinea sp.]
MAAESTGDEKKEDQKIRFTLEVSSSLSQGTVGKIDFKMNLNPTETIIGIDENLSGYKELLVIFEEIGRVLGDINARTDNYKSATKIDPEEFKRLQFSRGYDENFMPSFGKIDKIHFKHESPRAANVSYTRTYNGDMPPPN